MASISWVVLSCRTALGLFSLTLTAYFYLAPQSYKKRVTGGLLGRCSSLLAVECLYSCLNIMSGASDIVSSTDPRVRTRMSMTGQTVGGAGLRSRPATCPHSLPGATRNLSSFGMDRWNRCVNLLS